MNRMLLYTLVILALALVQACQIHHNLTFPAVSQVSSCSAESLGHLRYSNQSLTRDLPTTSTSPMSLRLEYFNCGKPFGALGL